MPLAPAAPVTNSFCRVHYFIFSSCRAACAGGHFSRLSYARDTLADAVLEKPSAGPMKNFIVQYEESRSLSLHLLLCFNIVLFNNAVMYFIYAGYSSVRKPIIHARTRVRRAKCLPLFGAAAAAGRQTWVERRHRGRLFAVAAV
ncbi:hypothetical protein EVAR_4384_1 [Eumeta japonica]|uniref:Uncharacterized protein n=1 Tax=Eumeta variegata TaxID=151549 RepID=A0A4C1T074_EUMVA|nr:hypothetical protein EVAR_4384_1 [Eumeta japonica]